MNKFIRICCSAMLGSALSFTVLADQNTVTKALKAAMPEFKIDSVSESAIPGVYEVMAGSSVFYVSGNGQFLIEGHLIDIQARKDVTEPKIAKGRASALAKLGTDKMITFAPDKPKHTVSIFTDIDCGYCRKLHSEIDNYLAEGIQVQYLFFPRAGENTESFYKAVSVWCADDQQKALTDSKAGKDLGKKACDNPVKEHMALGAAFGARGTPLIVTGNGNMIPGYVNAKQLLNILEKEQVN